MALAAARDRQKCFPAGAGDFDIDGTGIARSLMTSRSALVILATESSVALLIT